MTTTTHSPGHHPVSPALRVLRVLLVALVAVAGLAATLAALAVVATHPLALVLFGLPVVVTVGFGVLFGVGRLGAAVAERVST
ncbi:hypothetical protein [Halobacterium wangiae]|uniref:hypothetical protein n=1 Tax=Halobacterium wangiae TaxID=2902623 RepID=UPI001E635802|nr:hypothetical protein [Halobacterium wangiae]